MSEVLIYTDGACSGNPGPGGWGAVIIEGGERREIFGSEDQTTNQRMELLAAVKALEALDGRPQRVTLVSDSAYMVNCFRDRWYERWQRNGWVNAKKQPVQNRDLWERLVALAARYNVRFVKTKGHADDELNNRADALARQAVRVGGDRAGADGGRYAAAVKPSPARPAAPPRVKEGGGDKAMANSTPRGAILQKDKETYAIVPRLQPCGLLDVETLRRLADVAEKFEVPVIKITGAQRIAMVGFTAENVEPAWEALEREPAPAVGPCIHYVTACPGTAYCRLAQQDALALGTEMDEKLLGYGEFSSKFKIGISGCPMNCCESWLRDFGAFGRRTGWTVVVGGKGGMRPRIGDKLAESLPSEEVVALLYKTLEAYQRIAKRRERLGAAIERVGFEEFAKLVRA